MSKEEFIRQRDAYRVQEDERMAQIQRLRTEKNQIFLPVRKDADNLQTVVSAAEEAGDVMNLSQNVVETFIDRIEVFNDKRVKIRFTFEDEQIEGRSMDLKCRLYRHKWVQSITVRDVMESGQVVENPMIGAIPSRNEVQRELDDLLMSMQEDLRNGRKKQGAGNECSGDLANS